MENEKIIDSLRIGDCFWVTIQNHFISFSWKGLPKDVHFTLAYNDKSRFINLHISKNSLGVDPEGKPRIEIVRVRKTELEREYLNVLVKLLGKFLTPFDLEEFISRATGKIKFIPFEKLEEETTMKQTQAMLTESFNDISKIRKKTRLKIDGDFEGKLHELISSDSLLNFLNEHVQDFNGQEARSKGGLLTSESETVGLIRVGEIWHTYNNNIDPYDLLSTIIPASKVFELRKYIMRSLIHVKNANSRKDVDPFNKPKLLNIMGTSLIAICNSSVLEEINSETAELIFAKLKALNLKRALNADGTLDQRDWEYNIYDFNDRLRIEFESGSPFAPVVYKNISEISTILRFSVIYYNFKLEWFQDFRKELFSIVQILGGTEVIYMADNAHPLEEICDSVGEDGITYQDIKAMLLEKFGLPITDYSKLSLDESDKYPSEYFLDEFIDLKSY